MATNVDDIIKKLSPAERKKVEARAAELIAEGMTLRELRHARKLTQVKMAKKLGVTQDSVSRLEKRSDLLLSTLRKTVEAMMTDEHTQKVIETYRTRAELDKYSHLASPAEIQENEYNLNIPRYVDTFEPEEEIDMAALQKEIGRLEDELVDVRGRMAGYLKELGIHVER